ncbi:MAG: type II secretion system protein [Candidatus Saccharimonadales bacterium]
MLTQIKKRNEGFTIIEVLIVLAIAGLILLVVFLAVPALQRNSRNTQRKNEVSALLGAVNEWTNNNSGKLPTATGTERADALANAKLSFYSGNVTWGSAGTNSTTADTAVIVTGAKCAATGGDTAAGSSRQLAVMYTVETGGTAQKLCQDS